MYSHLASKVAVCHVYSSLLHAEGCQLLGKKWVNQFVERVQETIFKQVASKMVQFVCNTNFQLSKKIQKNSVKDRHQ
jgi:hypothetical protein